MSQLPKLTTTSYVILGHLALRDWSTYELAQQMKRSTRHYWPRAESKIYEEPKKLVAVGLAAASREYTGRRGRTIYTITAKGRRRPARVADEPAARPCSSSRAWSRSCSASTARESRLLKTIAAIREEAERTRDEHVALAADLVATGGPFPDRLHVNEVVFEFMWQQTSTDHSLGNLGRGAGRGMARGHDPAARPAGRAGSRRGGRRRRRPKRA